MAAIPRVCGLAARYIADMLKSKLAGLSSLQIAMVTAVFFLTLIGALALVFVFRWYNGR